MNVNFRIAIKGLLLYSLMTLALGLVIDPGLGRVSVYNSLLPGRERLPFGENPREAYNFSLFDLDAMIAAHQVSREAPDDLFRVFVLGDSSIWGTLLRPEETLTGQLNAMSLTTGDGRNVQFYNLGYPTLSLTKDLMVLDAARGFRPDMVIWGMTLEAFPADKQVAVPLVENNPARLRSMLEQTSLRVDGSLSDLPGFWDRTLIGRRKAAADWLRLQLYGVMWAATGIDQVYPSDYPPAQVDLEPDRTFHGKERLEREDLAFDALSVVREMGGGIPVILVNEPILISKGQNSEIRYNFYYPRDAYDDYRRWLEEAALEAELPLVDAWDLVPPEHFTNSAIHIDAAGTALLAQQVREAIFE